MPDVPEQGGPPIDDFEKPGEFKPRPHEPLIRSPGKLIRLKGEAGTFTFYRKMSGEPVTLMRGMVLPDDAYPELAQFGDDFEPFPSVPDWVEAHPEGSILCIRTFAAGDVIQILPILREMANRWPRLRVGLATDPRFSDGLLKRWHGLDRVEVIEHREVGCYWGWDVVINVDGMLEPDHEPDQPMAKAHRVAAYARFLLGCPAESWMGD